MASSSPATRLEGEKAAATFRRGLVDSLPICIGYCAVSFTLSAVAAAHRHPFWSGPLLALAQFSGTSHGAIVGKIDFRSAATAGFGEVFLLCVALNLRYALMAMALAQKLPAGASLRDRILAAMSVTDEIVAVAVSRPFALTIAYVGGLFAGSFLGWNAGTWLGLAGTSLLPPRFVAPLGIALYAMFVAIVVPAARASRRTLCAVVLAIAMNLALAALPDAVKPPDGVSMLLSGVTAAAACAFAFPPKGAGRESAAPDSEKHPEPKGGGARP